MDPYNSPVMRIPRKILYEARAAADRITIVKNRDGKQSKLQKALGRLKEELRDDEVVVVIRSSSLRQFDDPMQKKYVAGGSTMQHAPESEVKLTDEELAKLTAQLTELATRISSPSVTDQAAQRTRDGWSKPLTSSKDWLDSFNRMR